MGYIQNLKQNKIKFVCKSRWIRQEECVDIWWDKKSVMCKELLKPDECVDDLFY